MNCPICGCLNFFVKNPEDEYDIHRFSVNGGGVCFHDASEAPPVVDGETRVYCERCAWHGRLRTITGE